MSESDEAAPALTTPQEWRRYLREYSEVYLRTANEYQRAVLDPGQAAARWMGREPATEEAVVAAEQRLGVEFPPSFRSFLLTTDGWDGVGGWVSLVYGCADISWLRDTGWGEEFIEIYSDESDGNDEYVTLFQRSLEITNGEDFWFLDPAETGPDGEWAAYLFTPKYGEMEKYASFAEMVHASRQLMEMLAEGGAAGQ